MACFKTVLGCAVALLAGCSGDGGFAGVRSLDPCTSNYLICDTAAGCVLDNAHYVEGLLPGERQVIFRTLVPATVQVRLLFTEEHAPGENTQIEWNESGCGSQKVYSTRGQDVFVLAGDSQQISAAQMLMTPGDHLIRLSSDATVSYQMRVESVP